MAYQGRIRSMLTSVYCGGLGSASNEFLRFAVLRDPLHLQRKMNDDWFAGSVCKGRGVLLALVYSEQ